LGELTYFRDVPIAKSSKVPRIMYIESKAESLNGPARIGRVTFSKTGLSIYYKGKTFLRIPGIQSELSRCGDARRVLDFWTASRW